MPTARPRRCPGITRFDIEQGEKARFLNAAGGGYGDPFEREPERVLDDVLRGFETRERARDAYGVVLSGSIDDEDLAIDEGRDPGAKSGEVRRLTGGRRRHRGTDRFFAIDAVSAITILLRKRRAPSTSTIALRYLPVLKSSVVPSTTSVA